MKHVFKNGLLLLCGVFLTIMTQQSDRNIVFGRTPAPPCVDTKLIITNEKDFISVRLPKQGNFFCRWRYSGLMIEPINPADVDTILITTFLCDPGLQADQMCDSTMVSLSIPEKEMHCYQRGTAFLRDIRGTVVNYAGVDFFGNTEYRIFAYRFDPVTKMVTEKLNASQVIRVMAVPGEEHKTSDLLFGAYTCETKYVLAIELAKINPVLAAEYAAQVLKKTTELGVKDILRKIEQIKSEFNDKQFDMLRSSNSLRFEALEKYGEWEKIPANVEKQILGLGNKAENEIKTRLIPEYRKKIENEINRLPSEIL